MMAGELSNLGFCVEQDESSSVSEFEERLKVYLTSNEYDHRWVFWRRPKVRHPLDYKLVSNGPTVQLPSSGSIPWIENTKYKIKRMLEKMTSCHPGQCKYLVQFWVPELIDHHLYLTAADQPFAVGLLCKGALLYRQRCMAHRYRVGKGAREGELGVVGRVFRNKLPESSPDLRLYTSHEFPLRDVAACYGLRSLLALPLVDSRKEKCYGVLEVYYSDFGDMVTHPLEEGLKAEKLRTTHANLGDNFDKVVKVFRIAERLEVAFRAMPQLQIAQVWVPCYEYESSNMTNDISCMQRAAFVNAVDGKMNSLKGIDEHMCNYLTACNVHSLPVGKHTNMIAAVMSSKSRSCVCLNVCDFSISENPLVHYAQKARLSFCFAICLQSMTDSKDVYVFEFFLQFNGRGDEMVGSFVSLLLRIMEMELKSFEFAYRGQQGQELGVEVYKGNKIPNALRNESIKFKHQHLEKHSMLLSTKGYKRLFVLSDFTKYLEKVDLNCLQPSERSKRGWVFWSPEVLEEEVNSNSSLVPNPIHEKVKHLMREITSTTAAYSLAQFWAPKLDGDRCYLESSGQPFAVGCLYRGLADFRKQCMENRYFVDEGAKEEELGPPGRVFLKGHLEFTPDLRLYSAIEFPLRNHAIHCGLRKYLALPLFDFNHYRCVGVLELIEFSSSALEVIGIAMGAANLCSSHINFNTSLQGSLPLRNNVECRQLALTEIQEAYKLFKEIPQLFMMEVWVSQNKCPIKSNTRSCMERVWASKSIPELDLPMCQIQCVEAGKGIAGMTIASENTSCFCPHSCEFSIADQPLAHLVSRARLNGCFAICLQSLHTGDLLYALQFYINPGRGTYEYLRSFLCLLLPIMKQKLKSFKVASGQQLGEKLVVEVISSSEVDELASSKSGLPDRSLFEFKLVKYGGEKHSKDKQVQLAPEESFTSVAEAEHNITPAANFKKKDEANEQRRASHLNINSDDLESHSGQKRKDAANAIDMGESTLKRICVRGSANESARDSQQNRPLHQNVPPSDPKSSQDVIVIPKLDTVVIYAKYENKTIKFKLSNSAGMEKLVNEVATRLKLEEGSLEMEYLDEINEKIMLTCDADLELCLESLAAVGKPYIQIFVRSIKI